MPIVNKIGLDGSVDSDRLGHVMSDVQLTQQRIKDTLGTIQSILDDLDGNVERAETCRLYTDLKDWIQWAQDMDHVTDGDIWHVICHDIPICAGFGGMGSLPKSSGGAPSAYTKQLTGKEKDLYIAKRFSE